MKVSSEMILEAKQPVCLIIMQDGINVNADSKILKINKRAGWNKAVQVAGMANVSKLVEDTIQNCLT